MKTNKFSKILAVGLIILFLSACKGQIYQMERIFVNEKNLTQEQAETFAQHGVRLRFVEKDEDQNLKMIEAIDGKMVYKIDYNAIESKIKAKKLHDSAMALEEILDPRNKAPIVKYINDLDIRDKQLRRLAKFKIIESRYNRLNKYKEFLEKEGFDKKTIESNEDIHNDLALRYLGFNLEEKTKFEPKYVTETRNKEANKITDTFVLKDYEFLVTRDNPDYPQKDNTKETIEVLEKFDLLFESIDINDDKNPDWIEMYRLDKDGARVKYPSIAIYKTISKTEPSLLLYDIDIEGPSFGVPEGFNEDAGGIKNGLDIINDQTVIFELVLNGRSVERKLNFIETKADMKVYTARPGDIIVMETEINVDGWPMPSTQYVFNENFVLYYKFAAPEESDDEEKPDQMLFKVEWVAKQYFAKYEWQEVQQRVVEFYKLKPEYAGKEFEKFTIFKNDIVKFSEIGKGKLEEWAIKYFIAEHPYKISYDSGEDRVTLIDEDGDQKYEKMSKEQKTDDNGLKNNELIKKETGPVTTSERSGH